MRSFSKSQFASSVSNLVRVVGELDHKYSVLTASVTLFDVVSLQHTLNRHITFEGGSCSRAAQI